MLRDKGTYSRKKQRSEYIYIYISRYFTLPLRALCGSANKWIFHWLGRGWRRREEVEELAAQRRSYNWFQSKRGGRSIEPKSVPTEPDIEKFAAHPREIRLRVEEKGGEGGEGRRRGKKRRCSTDRQIGRLLGLTGSGLEVAKFFSNFSPFLIRQLTDLRQVERITGGPDQSDQFKSL